MIKSICFSGHRTDKIKSLSGDYYEKFVEIIKNIIYIKTVNFISEGYLRFYIGMSDGVDLWIGETLLELKLTQYPDLEIIPVRPFKNHGYNFSLSDKAVYYTILEFCNNVICLNDKSTKSGYLKRNRYMVDNSQKLYAIVSDYDSGTGYTINYAKEKNKSVEILDLNALFNDFVSNGDGNAFYNIKKYI